MPHTMSSKQQSLQLEALTNGANHLFHHGMAKLMYLTPPNLLQTDTNYNGIECLPESETYPFNPLLPKNCRHLKPVIVVSEEDAKKALKEKPCPLAVKAGTVPVSPEAWYTDAPCKGQAPN